MHTYAVGKQCGKARTRNTKGFHSLLATLRCESNTEYVFVHCRFPQSFWNPFLPSAALEAGPFQIWPSPTVRVDDQPLTMECWTWHGASTVDRGHRRLSRPSSAQEAPSRRGAVVREHPGKRGASSNQMTRECQCGSVCLDDGAPRGVVGVLSNLEYT